MPSRGNLIGRQWRVAGQASHPLPLETDHMRRWHTRLPDGTARSVLVYFILWRRSQADEETVKIIEDFLVFAIDRAVRFIDDDQVKDPRTKSFHNPRYFPDQSSSSWLDRCRRRFARWSPVHSAGWPSERPVSVY